MVPRIATIQVLRPRIFSAESANPASADVRTVPSAITAATQVLLISARPIFAWPNAAVMFEIRFAPGVSGGGTAFISSLLRDDVTRIQ